jgi:hypothetical protein
MNDLIRGMNTPRVRQKCGFSHSRLADNSKKPELLASSNCAGHPGVTI